MKGEVSDVTEKGVVVKLSRNVTGFITLLHVSDVGGASRDPRKKFQVGQAMKCRVLAADVGARKVLLTNKKTLVRSKKVILADYDAAEVCMDIGWVKPKSSSTSGLCVNSTS